MHKVDVCLSPLLFPLHETPGAAYLMIDAIRASTSITTALDNGAALVRTAATLEEAFAHREQGFLLAGERDSIKVEGFDFGNSPEDFLSDKVAGQRILFSTTNGTRVVKQALDARPKALATACFLNFSAAFRWLEAQNSDLVICCSGWKDNPNIEDTLLAGMLVERLVETGRYEARKASANIARFLHEGRGQQPLFDFLYANSPRVRANIELLREDIYYCMRVDTLALVPVFDFEHLGFVGQQW